MKTQLPKKRFYQKTYISKTSKSKTIAELKKYADYCIEQQGLVAKRKNSTSPENIKEFKEWGYKYSDTIRKIEAIEYEISDCKKPYREEYIIPRT